MGTNWHESYLATFYHNDMANQLYQHTFKGRMGTNWHESYTRSIFTITFFFFFSDSNSSHEGGSESAISNQEVTIIVPNKRVQ